MGFFKQMDIVIQDLPANYDELTQSERAETRHAYEYLQDGKCYHCQNLLSRQPHPKVTDLPVNRALFPEGFFKHPVHLHHNHETGMTIGAVHAWCNAVLWQYEGE